MPITDPALLHLVGSGFRSDAYAADGHHLRWSFDQRLGFPRRAFCLERRLSKERDNFAQDIGRREAFPRSRTPVERAEVVGKELSAAVAGGRVTIAANGVALPVPGGQPLVVDLHGGSSPSPDPISWVRLELFVSPGGRVTAEGIHHGWAEDAVVAIAQASDDRREWWADLLKKSRLDRPGLGLGGHPLRDVLSPVRRGEPDAATSPLAHKELRDAVALSDPALARTLSAPALAALWKAVSDRGVPVGGVAEYLSAPRSVVLILAATRIDAVRLIGAGAWIDAVQWVNTGRLAEGGRWAQVGCYPILTNEKRYREDNRDVLQGPTKDLAYDLLTGPTRPTGVEPMDEPEVPPTRPATENELLDRYLYPWVDQLEPWIEQVLAESLGGARHQSEVEVNVPLDEISTPGGGNVAGTVGPFEQFDVASYPLLLVASMAFQVARQLGLGCAIADVDDEAYDYRLRGWWLEEDLRAWPESLGRRAAELAAAVPDETPEQLNERLVALAEALAEQAMANASVAAIIAAEGPIVELHAYAFGVRLATRALFAGAASLTVAQLGAVAPPADGTEQQGLARLSWPLRARSGSGNDVSVPVGATLARTKRGNAEPYFDVLNARNDYGRPLAVVPVEDQLAPGGAGTTEFFDRHVPPNVDLTYGVSECDPFGRWSPFTPADSRWNHLVPPPPPPVNATLEDQKLTILLSWPPPGFPGLSPSGMTLRIRLRRNLPVLPTDPTFDVVHDPGQWPSCSRTAVGTAPPFSFPASIAGATSTTHDGMSVTVEPVPPGFKITFDGIAMSPDALARTRIYVAATAADPAGLGSTRVGGPAMAEHVAETPPPVPAFPADPLLATYPDALDRSTWTLTFAAQPGTRYTLFRAGEYDVVAAAARLGHSTAAYDAATTPATRAAALKALAVHARDAFAPGPFADASGTSLSLTDTLPGGLQTLSVYTVVGRASNGSSSPWPAGPSGFAVVRVPQIPAPSTPLVVRGEWREAMPVSANPEEQVPHVVLTIAAPPLGTDPVVRYEVYRTVEPALATDVRRMTPLHSILVPADTTQAPWSLESVAGADVPVVRWRDAVLQDWTAYAYRVVARGPVVPGVTGASAGTRSAASQVITVSTLSAAAPNPTSVLATLTPGSPPSVTVSLHVTVPAAAGSFRGVVRQVLTTGHRVQVARETLDPALTTHTLSGDVLPLASGESVTVEVSVIDALGRESTPMPATTAPMP